MITINGKQWTSEEKYNEYKNNVHSYMQLSLAIENYAACNNDESVFQEAGFKALFEFRKNKKKLEEKELLYQTAFIISALKNIINKIGKEKFTIYEDGDVVFNWPQKK